MAPAADLPLLNLPGIPKLVDYDDDEDDDFLTRMLLVVVDAYGVTAGGTGLVIYDGVCLTMFYVE
jgi:hypothetical protein